MCGITGIYTFNLIGKLHKIHVNAATNVLEKRGPDNQKIFVDDRVALGHRRLSIIDTTSIAHQPMWDHTERFCIVFNGEIFNYRELRAELEQSGIPFKSGSDTEVLLYLYITQKEKCLERLNGFFSFAIYDQVEGTLFIGRDRYGVKPLLYVYDDDKFIFGSEMKTILQYGIEKEIDTASLYTYLQLNYIPAPHTIFRKVKKLLPGHYAMVRERSMEIKQWYEIPRSADVSPLTYEQAKKKFSTLLEESVQRRLVADVPLGAFLSGGVDSSVIVGLAKRHKPDLHTFSIGFRDEKFFDETHYASLVAKHFQTNHTVFSISNKDLFENAYSVLDYIDEPFADSSALNVFILSKETRKHSTVALSGDGADEMLGGYNKHAAFYKLQHRGFSENLVAALQPLWKSMPQSRNNKLSNAARQLARFAEGANLSLPERYWRWAGFATESDAFSLLSESSRQKMSDPEYHGRKSAILRHLGTNANMNDIFRSDMELVLPNDMLTKVDLMSMANSLEVRTPFLDVELVNFIFSLPEDYKINRNLRKRILQDSFRDVLPVELYNRPKKGFEVPLLKWFRKEMRSLISDDLLSEQLITDQKIFNYSEIARLKKQLFSNNPGDVHARIWGLIVFQWWWKRYCH